MVYTIGNENYTRRTKILVTGAGSGAQTDYQLKLAATWAAAMQADWDDVRFTKADMQTLIDAWLESKVDSTSADIWVEFPTTPANTVEQTYYMYYGKSDAASDWDGDATFLSFNDFEDGSAADYYALHASPTIETVTNPVYDGTYSLHTAGTGGYEYAAKNFSSIDNFAIHFHVRTAENNLDHFLFVGQDYSNPIRPLALKNTGVINYFNGSSWTAFPTPTSYSADTWYEVECRVQASSDKFEVLWDGSSIGSNLWDTTFTPTTCDMFIIGNGNGADIYLDDVFIRKYAANPPTYAFGAEEHQRRTPMMM